MRNVFLMKKIIYLLTLILVAGCYKDADFFVPDSTPAEQFVKSGFSGMVTDESGAPIAGARVAIGNRGTETDMNGVYFLENVSVNIKQSFVSVNKSAYYESSRTLTAKVNAQINLNFTLIRKQEIGTFAATAGETFSLPDGAVLEIPMDGIADFTGQASFYANIWDLTDINFSSQMPGDLIGEDENGEEKSLIPYGMLVIASDDDTGTPLKVAPNKTFKISIPVSDNNPPTTIALWLFDKIEGVWKQKGTAVLEGQFYVAEVSEFGHWAIADVAEKIDISGTVFKDSEPAGNILVALRYVATGITQFTYTNSRGAYNFKIAANTSVKVGVYSRACNEFKESKDIAVGVDDLDNQDFSSGNGITVFSGQARDCNKELLTDGYAIIDDRLIVKLDETGRFSGMISDAADCMPFLNFQTFDIRNQEAAPIALPENTSPVQIYLVACERLNEFTNFSYNNRSLLLSSEAVATLESEGANEEGIISLADENIGTLLFRFKGNSAGTYTVSSLELNDQLNSKNFEILETDVTITLDETVEMGETLTGSFGGDFLDIDGATHSLSGNFRVIKDN